MKTALPVVTRTGVVTYGVLGDTVRELVPTEVTTDQEFLNSFNGRPIKLGLPEPLVDLENLAGIIGTITGPAVVDDDGLLVVPVDMNEQPPPDSVVCIGFICEVENTPGIHPEFGPYDTVQTSRRVAGVQGLTTRAEWLSRFVASMPVDAVSVNTSIEADPDAP